MELPGSEKKNPYPIMAFRIEFSSGYLLTNFFSQQAQEIKKIWIESWLPHLLAVTGHIIEPL